MTNSEAATQINITVLKIFLLNILLYCSEIKRDIMIAAIYADINSSLKGASQPVSGKRFIKKRSPVAISLKLIKIQNKPK